MSGYDVAVIGLGAMGSAALATLARRGVRAVGIERFALGHDRGSSHGETRMIRMGYFEHPSYVPLLRRAYELWRDLEGETGRRLLTVTGIAEIGPPTGAVVAGTLAASRLHGLPHEVVSARELMRRLPFRVPADYVGVLQGDGGFLAVEPALETFLALARAAGAQIRAGETVRNIVDDGDRVVVRTDRGEIEAGAAIVAAGAWLPKLFPDFPVALHVTREAFGWFAPLDPAPFAPERFPVFLLETDHGVHYGFPLDGQGRIKFAKHHHRGERVDPDAPARPNDADDEALMRSGIAAHLPAANGKLVAAKTCLYTNTPDQDFLLDTHPQSPRIVIASPCSGHGFKFAPVIGEIVADLATTGTTAHGIARFRWR